MVFFIHSPKYGAHEVLIDDEDAGKVFKHTWHLHRANNKKGEAKHVEACTNVYKKDGTRTILALHTLITRYKITDHINGNGLDNRKENLRKCSHAENCQNQKKSLRNTTGYKGVYLQIEKRRKKPIVYIRACIQVNKKIYRLGSFKTTRDAALAYNEAAIKYHGKFAWLNVI